MQIILVKYNEAALVLTPGLSKNNQIVCMTERRVQL